jgi:hypothetical protein
MVFGTDQCKGPLVIDVHHLGNCGRQREEFEQQHAADGVMEQTPF